MIFKKVAPSSRTLSHHQPRLHLKTQEKKTPISSEKLKL